MPPAVQTALDAYAQGAEIEDIDKGTLQGRTVYEAAFKHQGKTLNCAWVKMDLWCGMK